RFCILVSMDTKALGRMAFVILKTFCNRIEKLGLININQDLFNEMIQYNLVKNEYQSDIFRIEGVERPPIVEIAEYRKKFKIKK
ncbi:MAG: glucosyl-3-phosphoglycerate synthase, partial [Thermodesulfobacteriota bacterium]|nr:glucosyl-3-phosphoglycerate synthase [Thermodesulfobacteriota bacterium]